jgi:hypothetical protein
MATVTLWNQFQIIILELWHLRSSRSPGSGAIGTPRQLKSPSMYSELPCLSPGQVALQPGPAMMRPPELQTGGNVK